MANLRKGPEFFHATPAQKVMYLSGIPSRYWDATRHQLEPALIKYIKPDGKVVKVPKEEQTHWIDTLVDQPGEVRVPRLIGIGGDPTDDMAMAMGAVLCKTALAQQLRVDMVDLGSPPERNPIAPMPDLLVLHNVVPECDHSRIQTTRDWLHWSEGCNRVVIMAGTDPLSFFATRIRMPIDLAFYFKATLRKVNKI